MKSHQDPQDAGRPRTLIEEKAVLERRLAQVNLLLRSVFPLPIGIRKTAVRRAERAILTDEQAG